MYHLINKDYYSGKITYDKDEMIIHMPEFYEYVLKEFEDVIKDNCKTSKQFIEMLNVNNKYTLAEIVEIINFSIKNFDDLDSYGTILDFQKYEIIKCKRINL